MAREGDFPAYYFTKANLNVRMYDFVGAKKVGMMPQGTIIKVDYVTDNNWAAITYVNRRAYCSMDYLGYYGEIEDTSDDKEEASSFLNSSFMSGDHGVWWWVLQIGIFFIVFAVLRKAGIYVLHIMLVVMFWLYWIVCIPFYILNWLQRHLSKPWRVFHKFNKGTDTQNREKREMYEWVKIPIYIVLTPLRFINAAYYNIIVHCSYELLDYVLELVLPSNDKEGADNYLLMVLLSPWRFVRYVVWHGGLTLIESAIWTVVDTFVPALTLFHGTTEEAAVSITNAGRHGYSDDLTGVWNVGGGNYAGNGIYFAPARSTAIHYSSGAMIVCRVSLGKVLDLGLAPSRIYNQCGKPNATGATRWGLDNGYTTGEWWRDDEKWWEYCMYDWQNRYNYSWRIRPLYVMNIDEKYMQRIPGGMSHWLFRGMVINDIIAYLDKKL